MMMRSMENTIYFASVNYALRFQESATSLITPSGQCQAYLPYGQEGVLVQAIKVEEATGLLATRYAPERYQEFGDKVNAQDQSTPLRREHRGAADHSIVSDASR